MPSSQLSSFVFDPDGGNEVGSEQLALLLSTKTELENILQRAIANGEKDPSSGGEIAEEALRSIESLKDPLELGCDGCIDLILRFFECVALLSDLLENLRIENFDDIKSLSGALDACIARGERMLASDFKLSLDKRFEEVTDIILKICIARQTHSKRNYVALIKIHNRLLEKVDEPILRQSHVASLVHSMGGEIQSSLTSESDPNWKLVAFVLKRIVFVSNKCSFRSDDPQYIRTLANLYELRLSDHPLSKPIEKIELWKLVDFDGVATVSGRDLGIGFVLLCCDVTESMLESQGNRLVMEFCIRTIYSHASDVVLYMFHRIRGRPLFDHCLHILCQGLVSIGSSSILDEISAETVSLEQQLLHDEACRYFRRKEISYFDPVDILASLGHSNLLNDRSEKDLRTFFEKTFQNVPMKPLSTPLEYTRVRPCSANSALLFSLISSFTPRTMTDFLVKASELAEVVTANSSNDCLLLCACNFFSSARGFALRSVEDLSKQAPIIKLKEIVLRSSSNSLINAFGATSLIIFAFGTDLPKWLDLRSPLHQDFVRSFVERFNFDHWKTTLRFLSTGDVMTRRVNTYVELEKPTADPLKLPAELCDVECSPTMMYSNALELESRCLSKKYLLTTDDNGKIKECIKTLERIIKRRL